MDFKQLLIDLQKISLKSLKKIEVESLVDEMMENIGDIDPHLRDELIYSTFVQIFKEDVISKEQTISILDKCISDSFLFLGIDEGEGDFVFTRSFSSLVIALILRADAKKPMLSEGQLGEVYSKIFEYIEREQDTRGYLPKKGWAHSIAHAADMLAAYAAHPKTSHIERTKILSFVVICLCKDTVYTDAEDHRLAKVAIACLNAGYEEAKLEAWLGQLVADLKFDNENPRAYFNKIGNTSNFIKSLYFLLKLNGERLRLRSTIIENIRAIYGE